LTISISMRAAVALALLGGAAASGPTASSAGRIKVDPRTGLFVDELGRARIFHGVNVVEKLAPFYPPSGPGTAEDPLRSLTAADIAQLHDEWGFNAVRLGVLWSAAMPDDPAAGGKPNATYLDRMVGIADALGAAGVHTIVDAHQDSLAGSLCGEGVPEWAIGLALAHSGFNVSDPATAFPAPKKWELPLDPATGHPDVRWCQNRTFFAYLTTDQAEAAWEGLYDAPDVRAAFAAHWGAVAAAFNPPPPAAAAAAAAAAVPPPPRGLIGYELINEPFKRPGLSISDKKALGPLYAAYVRATPATPATPARPRYLLLLSFCLSFFLSCCYSTDSLHPPPPPPLHLRNGMVLQRARGDPGGGQRDCRALGAAGDRFLPGRGALHHHGLPLGPGRCRVRRPAGVRVPHLLQQPGGHGRAGLWAAVAAADGRLEVGGALAQEGGCRRLAHSFHRLPG
jgi:hypothetical protein